MFDKFKRRSDKLEYIDTGDYTPAEYEGCIGELQLVNRWMGDAHTLKATLFREIEAQSLQQLFDSRCWCGVRGTVACDCDMGQANRTEFECSGSGIERTFCGVDQ